jgi:hypothetical protein
MLLRAGVVVCKSRLDEDERDKVFERLHAESREVVEHRRLLAERELEREMSSVTGTPKINKTRPTTSPDRGSVATS